MFWSACYVYGRLMCANMMFASVEEPLLFRFLEKAMPTWEKRRSTEADDAGQPTHQLLRYGASPRLGTWLWVLDVKVSIPPPWTCLGDPRQPQNSSQYARWSPQPSRRDLADGSKSARFGDVVPPRKFCVYLNMPTFQNLQQCVFPSQNTVFVKKWNSRV